MRYTLLAAPLLLLLSACSPGPPYTQQDLREVNLAYSQIRPIYFDFRSAYIHHDAAGIRSGFEREQVACRLVDKIDRRDSIDPNTKLFTASSALDSFCNDIESAYEYWAKAHHLPYDRTVVRETYPDVFKDGDYNMKRMRKILRDPAGLS